eukprot:5153564-Lingulodinium_polyedra.AAC.1
MPVLTDERVPANRALVRALLIDQQCATPGVHSMPCLYAICPRWNPRQASCAADRSGVHE